MICVIRIAAVIMGKDLHLENDTSIGNVHYAYGHNTKVSIMIVNTRASDYAENTLTHKSKTPMSQKSTVTSFDFGFKQKKNTENKDRKRNSLFFIKC